jgi:dephospho-CoA kinase
MYKLGITGGIGSGKSTATLFFKNNNTYIFDADTEAKKHLQNSIALQHKISNAFGADLKTKSGSINLKELGKRAFKNKTEQSNLNGIMWPEIYMLIEKKIGELKNTYTLFIVDAALIFEANLQNLFDSILLITADKNIRVERSSKRLNLSRTQINDRLNLQMDEINKIKLANYTIKNNNTIKELNHNLTIFYQSIILPKL